MELEKLIVPLALDAALFKKGLDDALDGSKSFGDRLGGIGDLATSGLTTPILAGAKEVIAKTNEWANTLDSLGDVLGTNADDSAALAVAIQGVGGNVDAITGQMAKLTKGLFDADGGIGKSGELLQSLGVAFQDANGDMLPATDILTGIADKLAAMPDGLEKTRLMTELFGKSGKDLSDTMNALANGGFENAKNKAEEMGLMLGDQGVANSIEMGKAMEDLKLSTQGLAVTFGTALIPLLTPLIKMIGDAVKWFTNLAAPVKNTILIVAGLVATVGPLLMVVGSLVSAFSTIIPIITAVAGVITFPLIAIVLGIAAVITLVALAWKNNWGDIQGKVQAVIDWMRPFIERALEGLQLVFKIFSDAFKGDWTAFGEDLRKLWDLAIENIKELWKKFTELDWGKIGSDIVQGIANGITSAVHWIIEAVKGIGAAAIAAIKGFLGISSPSQVFKVQVGFQIARGLIEGFQETMNKEFSPRISTNFQGMQPIYVNFEYKPMFSLANQREADEVLKPAVERIIRKL